MTLMDLPNYYFVARFELEVDFVHVLMEGQWMTFDNYVVVRQWDPLFRPEYDIIHTTHAWVRLSGLSMVHYEEQVHYSIAAAISNPIRVDLNTLTMAHRRFTRKVYLEYEGLHTICFRCGCYGHLVDKCHLSAPNNTSTNGGREESSMVAEARSNPSKRDIGPRMVVPPNRQKKSPTSKNIGTKNDIVSKKALNLLVIWMEIWRWSKIRKVHRIHNKTNLQRILLILEFIKGVS
ncbi:hypothetical protein V2J09_006235 [Rumex salicifolius]